MSLEATHIRLALDVQNKYQVKNLERYVNGVIYPDSRYVTAIDRLLTHPSDISDSHWEKSDDFKKGWLVHLLADKIQKEITQEKLPFVFEGQRGQGSEVWIKHTAIKVLQDLDDLRKFDIKLYLPYLKNVENPNGEDLKKVCQYNEIFIKMYNQPKEVNIDSYYQMLLDFGIGQELSSKVVFQAKEYNENKIIRSAVPKIYPKTIERFRI